jgi:hypothetical protein
MVSCKAFRAKGSQKQRPRGKGGLRRAHRSPRLEKKPQSQQKKQQPSKQEQKSGGKSKQQKRGNPKQPSDSQDKGSDNKRRRRGADPGGDAHSRQRDPSSIGKKARPSIATLALSAQLKDLSRQKRLDEALELYWKRYKGHENVTRDEHHAYCRGRLLPLGAVDEAERIVQDLRRLTKST